MNLWLLKDGEHLPLQSDVGKMRTWMLGEAAAARGHDVTWWSSNHSHQQKRRLTDGDRDIDVAPRFRVRLLDAGGYRHNRSVRRVMHHRRLAMRFRQQAEAAERPDLIVTSFPFIELASEGVEYARRHGIPVLVDIRDPWPDVFEKPLRDKLGPMAAPVLSYFDSRARECLRRANALVAVSDGFLDWALAKAGRTRAAADRVFYIGARQTSATSPRRRAALLSQLGADDDAIVFLFVGSFGYSYQLELIGRLAERMCAAHPAAHFVIAGDGTQRATVERHAARLSNFHYLGWQAGPRVRELLASADVGLAPYDQLPGCLPNKVVEYLSAGLPVLSSIDGDLPSLLDRYGAGLSYGAGCLDECYEQAAAICASPAVLQRMARGAERLFTERFEAEAIYASYVDHLERLVHETRNVEAAV